MPLISVITPTFRDGHKLEQTIQSVLSQDQALFEYWVIDGGSDDQTVDLLKSHSSRLSWRSEPDRGVYDAMNKGAGLTSGKYLYFLGAGDLLRPGVLSRIAPLLPTEGSMTLAYGDIWEPYRNRRFNGHYNKWKLSRVNIPHQAIFCDRRSFEHLGGFDLKYSILADYAFNIRCFGDKSIQKCYLNHIVADFEGGGLSTLQQDRQFFADRLALFRRNLGFWPYAINKAISFIPPNLKEARYQTFRRLRSRLSRHGG